MEFISPEGLRVDGRRPMELRLLNAQMGVVDKADGSAMFEMGNTKAIAVVYGPREVKNRSQQLHDQALVRCEYSMATFSTGERRKRKTDRRATELSLVIRQTMEAAILTHLMPRSQIDIFVQVLQADGGTRACCINAACMALADAGIPMQDLVASCSAGYLNVTPILGMTVEYGGDSVVENSNHSKLGVFVVLVDDLNYTEDAAGGPDLTVALFPKLDKISLLQMDSKVPMDVFESVMNLASEGAKAIADFIREKLMDNTKQLVYARGPRKQ